MMPLFNFLVFHFLLALSCHVQSQQLLPFTDCEYSNYTENAFKLPHALKKLLGGDGSDLPLLSFLRRLVHGPSSNVDAGAQDCMLKRLDDRLSDIESYMQSLFENAKLDRTLYDVRLLFDGVHRVYYAFKMMLKHKEAVTRRELRAACRQHSPLSALQGFTRRVTNQPKLFHNLLVGTGYLETTFNQLTSAIIVQVAMSAILAPKCIKMTSKNPSRALIKFHEEDIKKQLNSIELEYASAKEDLRTLYQPRAKMDLADALKHITESYYTPQQGADYIQKKMADKYPFRAWAIMLYRLVRKEATSVHWHEGSSNNWFHIDNKLYTVVAHSADKQANCSAFGSKFNGKSLRDMFQDNTEFANFATYSGDLGNSINRLKERLLPELPQTYFISIVTYRIDLKVARDADHKFHFFEHVRATANGIITKSVLIGWC